MSNPYPVPPDVYSLLHHFWSPMSSSAFELLVQYPWLRRHMPLISGSLLTTTLDVLSAIPDYVPSDDPEVAARDAAKIAAMESRLTSGHRLAYYQQLRLAIADGDTVPATPLGKHALALAAYRNVGSARVDVYLHWPHIAIGKEWFRWWQAFRGYDESKMEAAFKGDF